jgi:3-phosphoshikimate 1-carboxyvinyltransferase
MNPELSIQSLSSLPIAPITRALHASLRVPGSKSITNRALLLAALADGITTLTNALFSDDSLYFVTALQNLGFNVQLNPGNSSMTIFGLGGLIPAGNADLFIGNAGTAARFLTAFLTLGKGIYTIDGDDRMRERPIGDLVEALVQLGADVVGIHPQPVRKSLPVKINASGLPGGSAKIPGHISSQFLSALLMIAPSAAKPVEIEITTELNSKPYVDMTLALMADFGVRIERKGYGQFSIHPAGYSAQSAYAIESDASAAACFFAAPAICGGSVRVEHIKRASIQGDIRFLDVLSAMGCTVTENGDSIEVSGSSSLTGLDVDLRDIPDTAQTLAVVAPFAATPTRIRGIASARAKETDRIAATCAELRKVGLRVDEHADGMTIYPAKELHSALIHTYNDHRMAMAFALLGLRVPGITLQNPGCVSKTFPDFFQELEWLR